jgi:hypothetical protein
MKQATKAALISALVFPGLGHVTIGEKKKGWIILLVTLGALFILINEALDRASTIIEKLGANSQMMDLEEISRLAAESSQFSSNIFLNSVLIFIFICWVYAMVDAYRCGSKKDHDADQ